MEDYNITPLELHLPHELHMPKRKHSLGRPFKRKKTLHLNQVDKLE